MANGPLDPTPRLSRSQKRAKRVIRKLVNDPERYARYTVQGRAEALSPFDPLYIDKLKNLDKIVQTTPGSRPDSSLAILATGLDPDTEIGAALTQAQAFTEARMAAQDQAQEEMIQANADAARLAQSTGPMGYVQAFSQTLFAAAEATFQAMGNVGRNVIDDVGGGEDTSSWGDVFANTDLGFLAMGAANYAATGKLDEDMLDMGDGFFINEDSPVANLRKSWDQQMLGTAGQHLQELDELKADRGGLSGGDYKAQREKILEGTTIEVDDPITGQKTKRIVDPSPATLGQYAANRAFKLEVGSTPYSLVSGMLDLVSRGADPSMYTGVKNVNSAFVTGENLVRGKVLGMSADRLLPSADNVTAAMDQGALSSVAKRASDKVGAAREAEAPRLAELSDVDRNLLAASDELKLLREETGWSPIAAEAEAADARTGAVAHNMAGYGRERDLEGLARSTDTVFEQEAKIAEEDLAVLRKRELEERFTPAEKAADEPAPVADEAAGFTYPEAPQEGVPFKSWTPIPKRPGRVIRPDDPMNTYNFGAEVYQEDGVWKVVTSADKGPPQRFDTLEEANTAAYGTTVRDMESRFLNSPEGLNTDLEKWNALDQAGREAVIRSTSSAPKAAPSKAQGSVTAVLREDGKFDLIHRATGGRVAERATLEEAEALADDMSRMSGYADEVPLDDLRSFDHVRAEIDATPNPNARPVEQAAIPEPRPASEPAQATKKMARLRRQIEEKQAYVDSLKASREQIQSEAGLLTARRQREEAFLMEKAKFVADKLGVTPKGEDVDSTLAFMQRAAGLEEGVKTLDVDKAVAFITGNSDKNTSRLFKAMALIEDPAVLYEMTKGKWGAALRRDVAGAKTEQEVRAVLARHIARGDFNENVGRLRGIRIAAQVRHGKDTDVMLSRYGQAFGVKGLKAVSYGKQIRRSSVPWANARHIEDADGMTDLVYDTAVNALSMNKPKARANRGFSDAEKFRRYWVKQMDEAEDGMSRRQVWNNFNTALVERAGREFGLDEQTMAEFTKRMSLSHKQFNETTEYLAEVRAASKGKPVVIDGKEWDWGDVAALEAQLSSRVMAPNWDELRRAMKSVKEIEGLIDNKARWQDTMSDITGSVFERYWRASVIAFRGAYVLRNMADIQLRMYLKGHPSMFTSPQGVFALAFSHLAAPDTPSGRFMYKYNEIIDKLLHKRIRADGRLDGSALMPEDPDMDLATYFAAPFMDLIANRNMSHVDVGLAAKPDDSVFKTLGYTTKEVGPDGRMQDGFWGGWEFEIGLLQNSPMARAVLDVEAGNVPEHIQKVMTETGMGPREALVNYYVQGQGRRVLDEARSGGAAIRELTGVDPDMDDTQLFAYLFGDDAISLRSRWDRLTLNRDPEVVRAAVQRKASNAEQWRAQRRQMQALVKKRAREDGYLVKDDSGKWIENPDKPLPVRKVQSEVVDRDDTSRFARFFDDSLTWFFTKSGRFETAAGYLPEFRYAKWDQAADLAKALSPEDAKILVKNAREILGGKQLPNSWAASTLRRLERNAGQAKGTGAFRLADLDSVTDEFAGKQVQELFYNALNRNQFANSIRLLAPFAQPWANTLTEWTKLGLKNPNRVYAAGVVYAAGTGRGSNWLQDDPTNPNDSFFYRHPKTGQMMVGVPVMGPAIAGLASGISAIKGGPGISSDMVEGAVPLQSMNLAIQNSLLPGAGPMVSIPATMLEDTGWYQSYMPDVVKGFLQPFTNVDPDSETTVASTLMPAWLQGILGGALGVPDFTGKAQKYLQPTMGYLMQSNPDGRYGTTDGNGNFVQTTDQQNALLRDAEQLSSALLFGRSVIQNVSPGSPMPEVLAKADDGRLLSTTVLAQEYLDKLKDTGERGQALTEMADQYGTGVLFTLLPTRGKAITPTDDAYRFLKANPGQAEQFGSTLALFAPGGGYSARFDRFQRRNGENPTLSAEEMAREVNTLLKVAKEARLDAKLVSGELSQEEYDAEIQLLQDSYAKVPTTDYDTGGADVLRADLARNAQSSEMQLAFPDVARSVNDYEEYRQYALANNTTEGLSGAGNVEWRSWLRKKGSELVASNPNFRVAWVKAYGPEVKEDN